MGRRQAAAGGGGGGGGSGSGGGSGGGADGPYREIRGCYVSAPSADLTVGLLLVAVPSKSEVSASLRVALHPDVKGEACLTNAWLKEGAADPAQVFGAGVPYARLPVGCAASLVKDAVGRAGSVAKSAASAVSAFARVPLVELPSMAALTKSGAGTGVMDSLPVSADLVRQLFDSGPEYHAFRLTSELRAAGVAAPRAISDRTSWLPIEREQWVRDAASAVNSPALAGRLAVLAPFMARYHHWRDEHGAAQLLAKCAEQTAVPQSDLAKALLLLEMCDISVSLS